MVKKLLFLLLLLPLTLPASGQELSEWCGCARYDYQVDGRNATVVVPASPAPGKPWIWRPAFFGAFPSVDEALLKDGWHIAYYDVTHCYGSPASVDWAYDFYEDAMVRFGLNPKVVLEGFSRGGYFCFAWAQAYPETVSCIYLDAPVCDITSWPGRKDENLWNDFLQCWDLSDTQVGSDFAGNAIQRLPEIAEAGIPIIAVCGDSDTVVPYKENFAPVRDRYAAMGGIVELILKPGCDHHPHSLEDPEPVVDFIERHAPGYEQMQSIRLRGNLDNCMYAFTVRKKACVAFLGGSITEMHGWRDQIKEDLHQRFPDTEFQFIDAGIASLGSTPHAFRFERDVLQKGTPDLLFFEAAVNDDTNGFSPQAQIRGAEGVIRHALQANPMMDIVMMHFTYEPFVPMMESGEIPDVVLNHERVANRYHITSINEVQEIHNRMQAGTLTWERFGGCHPAWFGHKFYTASINSVLDAATRQTFSPAPHKMPSALDEASYSSGRLVSPATAFAVKGFQMCDSWTPSIEVGTRAGFVDVPMLATSEGGSLRFNFTGRAVGIFCVAGPDAAVISYRIDRGEWKTLDTYTEWSEGLYLPWVYMLGDDLPAGTHSLEIKVPTEGSRRGCVIRDFVVN